MDSANAAITCPADAAPSAADSKLQYNITLACIRQLDFWHNVSVRLLPRLPRM